MSREETEKDEIIEEPAVEETAAADDAPEEAAEPGDEAGGGDETDTLRAQVAELNDKILRMAAENQNTRKRLVKQQQDAHKYRHQDILKDLADVIDNFERAIDSSTESRDFDTFHEGIVMIEKQFSGMLTDRYGLERIGAEGEAFDPAAHEAMMMEESPDVDSEVVKQVFQAGYRLHDRVLRPAKVVVSKPAAAAETDSGDESAEDE